MKWSIWSSVCGSVWALNQGAWVSRRAVGLWCVQTPTAGTPIPAVLPPPETANCPSSEPCLGTVKRHGWVSRVDSCVSHPEVSSATHLSRILGEALPSTSSLQTCVCRDGACRAEGAAGGAPSLYAPYSTLGWKVGFCFHFHPSLDLFAVILEKQFAVTSICCLTFLGCKLFKMLSAPVQCLAQSFFSGQWGI